MHDFALQSKLWKHEVFHWIWTKLKYEILLVFKFLFLPDNLLEFFFLEDMNRAFEFLWHLLLIAFRLKSSKFLTNISPFPHFQFKKIISYKMKCVSNNAFEIPSFDTLGSALRFKEAQITSYLTQKMACYFISLCGKNKEAHFEVCYTTATNSHKVQ